MISARSIVGIVGNVVSFLLFVSPVQKFIEIRNKGQVGNFSNIPYLASFVNCAIWVLYGIPKIHPDNIPILVISCLGFVIEGIYLLIFIRYSPRNRGIVLGVVAGGATLFVFFLGLGLMLSNTSTEVRSRIVGVIGAVTNTFMYGSALPVMFTVIKTKNVENMSFLLTLCSLLNGIVWFSYAMMIPVDFFIAIPGGFGVVMSIAQLVVWFRFCGNVDSADPGGDVPMGSLNQET